MNIQSTDRVVHVSFDSVTSMLDDHRNHEFNLSHNQSVAGQFKKDRGLKDWYGLPNYDAVMKAFNNGNAKVEKIVSDLHTQCALKLSRAIGVGRKFKRGPEGDEVDVVKIKEGDFDNAWTSMIRKTKRGRTAIRLCVDIGGNASSAAQVMQWRGIAASLLTSIIHKAGYSVEIIACFAVKDAIGKSHKDVLVTCRVKPRMTQANISFLASTVCLPGFFRTLGFTAIANAADSCHLNVDNGLGSYTDFSRLLPVDNKVTTLFVTTEIRDEASTIKWVKETLQLLQGAKA